MLKLHGKDRSRGQYNYLRDKADTDGIKKTLQEFAGSFGESTQNKTVNEKWDIIKHQIKAPRSSQVEAAPLRLVNVR